MHPVNRRYLYHKLAKSVFGTALVFAVFISIGLYIAELDRASAKTIAMLNQLIDTVEDTAAVAAYSGNRQIGEDMLKGLLSNDIVHEARLANDRGLELQMNRDTDVPTIEGVTRLLQSPFGNEIIGRLILTPEAQFYLEEARHSAFYSALNSSLLIALTAIIVLQLVRSSLSRPLMVVSDTLHAIKAGERERLELPPRNKDDELGQLVTDVNGLLDALEERFEAERLLRKNVEEVEHRLRSIFETTSAGIFQLDGEGRLRAANPTLGNVLGLPDIAPESWAQRDFLDLVFADPARLRSHIHESVESSKPIAMDLRLRGDGNNWVHCLVSRQIDVDGAVLYEGVVYDITERREAERRVRQEADYDSLTGLYRRQPAERALKKLLENPSAGGRKHVVLLLDLDNFKMINDSRGHAAGDHVLKETARRLRSCVRSGDIVARLGGDEFLIVLVDCDPLEHASAVARDIIRAVLQPVSLGDEQPGQVGVSIGIAVHDHLRRSTVEQLLEAADQAMYEVKRQGKNGFGMVRPDGGIKVKMLVNKEVEGSSGRDRATGCGSV